MCGRFVQAVDPESYAVVFGAEIVPTETLAPSYNVAPTDRVYAVAEHRGRRLLGTFQWGLVPFWAKDPRIGARHINARAETVATAPVFRESFAGRRCIVPADGFFEWEQKERGRLPHYVTRRDGDPLALAGLWASRTDRETGERLVTCTIVTTSPNELLRQIHDRMPVVLPETAWDRWLDPETPDPETLLDLLVPAAAATLTEHPVSTLVNSVRNNFPECITPLT